MKFFLVSKTVCIGSSLVYLQCSVTPSLFFFSHLSSSCNFYTFLGSPPSPPPSCYVQGRKGERKAYFKVSTIFLHIFDQNYSLTFKNVALQLFAYYVLQCYVSDMQGPRSFFILVQGTQTKINSALTHTTTVFCISSMKSIHWID